MCQRGLWPGGVPGWPPGSATHLAPMQWRWAQGARQPLPPFPKTLFQRLTGLKSHTQGRAPSPPTPTWRPGTTTRGCAHHTPPASGAGGGQGAPRSNQGDPPPSSPGPKVAGSAPRTSRELGGGAPLTSQRGRPAAQPQHQRQPLRAAPPRSPAAHAAGLRRARGGEAPLGPAEPAQFTPPDLFFILFYIFLPAPPPLGAGPGQWRRSAASPTAPLGSALPLPLRPPSAGRIPNEPPLPHSQLAARGGH